MLGDIVGYNFFDLNEKGDKVYSLDYAIELDYNVEDGTIKLLPITNKYTDGSTEAFCIGKVDGFVEIQNEGYVQNDQYVHFDKVINVDKMDLSPVALQDVCGNITRSDNGDFKVAHLDDEQLEKVLRKYKIYDIGEKNSILNLIKKADPRYFLDEESAYRIKPVCDMSMDKYVEYDFSDKKVIVFYVDSNRYSATLNARKDGCFESRNSELKRLLFS